MTTRLPSRTAAIALFVLALGTSAALAQSQPADQPATAAPPGATATPGQAPAMAPDKRMAARVEQHITELHRRLHITAAEEPQWKAFAQVMRDNAMHMDQAFMARAQQGANMNAVDDLRSYAAVAQAHAEDMQRLIPAFQTLYSSLTPQQQKTADEVFRDFEHRRELRPG
jgi:hypothetical protein